MADKVNLFVDAQGFLIGGRRFFPRELAILGKNKSAYFSFDLPNYYLNEKDAKIVHYCVTKVHGIPWKSTAYDTY